MSDASPPPPYSCGIRMPVTPRRPNSAYRLLGTPLAASHSATCGTTRSIRKARIELRKASCSSVLVRALMVCPCQSRVRLSGAPLKTESIGTLRRRVSQELRTSLLLVRLTDLASGTAQRGQRAQEPLVGLMRPGHRALALPAAATKGVQRPVVAGACECVALDRVTVRERILSQGGPGQRRGRVCRRDGPRVLALREGGGSRVDRQPGLGDTQKVAHQTWVPALRRFWQASTTRAAM